MTPGINERGQARSRRLQDDNYAGAQSAHDGAQHLSAASAQCHAHADIASALRDHVRKHSVEADGRQKRSVVHQLLKAPDIGYRLIAIHRSPFTRIEAVSGFEKNRPGG